MHSFQGEIRRSLGPTLEAVVHHHIQVPTPDEDLFGERHRDLAQLPFDVGAIDRHSSELNNAIGVQKDISFDRNPSIIVLHIVANPSRNGVKDRNGDDTYEAKHPSESFHRDPYTIGSPSLRSAHLPFDSGGTNLGPGLRGFRSHSLSHSSFLTSFRTRRCARRARLQLSRNEL